MTFSPYKSSDFFGASIQPEVSDKEYEAIRLKITAGTDSQWIHAKWLGQVTRKQMFSNAHLEECLWWIKNYPGSRVTQYAALPYIISSSPKAILNEFIRLWELALRENPNDKNVLKNAAQEFSNELGEKSLTIYYKLISQHPKNPKYLFAASNVATDLSRESLPQKKKEYLRESLSLLHKAIPLDRNHKAVKWKDAAITALLAGEYDLVEEFCKLELKRPSESWEHAGAREVPALAGIGLAAFYRHDFQAARMQLQNIIPYMNDLNEYLSDCNPCQLAELLSDRFPELVSEFVVRTNERYFSASKDSILKDLSNHFPVELSEGETKGNLLAQKALFRKKIGQHEAAKQLLMVAHELENKSSLSCYSIGIMFDKLDDAEKAICNLNEALGDKNMLDEAKENGLLDRLSPEVKVAVEHFFHAC